ncbi:hypothetical protein CAXC1_50005 [Candidatus Xenohaliotis californiensis]|uniref:Uncharacterized protein n=1 Tax=Candidatus Xenohaliotis californiensis TaxID=84677 RepID=A0ABM9N937_9RICK|nr:hypothetical protein CAXC1_50005 [Candidatus Xenohaliotis californiensis]
MQSDTKLNINTRMQNLEIVYRKIQVNICNLQDKNS